MNSKHYFKLFASVLVLSALTAFRAFAGEKTTVISASVSKSDIGPGITWVQSDDGHWRFRVGLDEFATDCWKEIDKKWYLFDENSDMVTGWAVRDGFEYFLNTVPSSGLPLGCLLKDCNTPDGFAVDGEGHKIKGSNPVCPFTGTPTCVEVNLTEQTLNAYLEGSLAISSPCVTGKMTETRRTPTGRFAVYAKQTDRVLKGDNEDGTKYESHVDFWMPFSGGVGFHDAVWRSSFGGTIYQASGSHGCINLPHNVAQSLYENVVYVGIPVIVHW